MKYFKVVPEADQVRFNNPLTGWHLVKSELFTENEVNKMKFNDNEIKKYFNVINTSKFNTYFWFGARWQKSIN